MQNLSNFVGAHRLVTVVYKFPCSESSACQRIDFDENTFIENLNQAIENSRPRRQSFDSSATPSSNGRESRRRDSSLEEEVECLKLQNSEQQQEIEALRKQVAELQLENRNLKRNLKEVKRGKS